MAFLLDTNVFIQAKNFHYGFDFCPGFWDWIDDARKNGRVLSIEKVLTELKAGDDDLSSWAEQRPNFFIAPDASTLAGLTSVAEWAQVAGYEPTAVSTFLQDADYYLVAQAIAGNHVVVTHEKVSTTTKNIKIPNACLGLKVKCVTTFEMLRTEHVRLVLAA